MYMTIVLLCTLSLIRVSLVIDELLPFDCLNFNNFFVPQPKIGNKWMDFMKRTLNIYVYVVVMHVKFNQNFIKNRGVIGI